MSKRRHMQRAMGYNVPKHRRNKKLDSIPTIDVHINPDLIRKDHVVDLVAGHDYGASWLIRCSCGTEWQGTLKERSEIEQRAFEHVYGHKELRKLAIARRAEAAYQQKQAQNLCSYCGQGVTMPHKEWCPNANSKVC